MDVLLDTHAWVWSLTDDPRLSGPARAAILGANAVRVSPMTFFEIGQKVGSGQWPEMTRYLDTLEDQLYDQGGLTAPFTPEVALASALMDWDHRDPVDRILAATAIVQDATLLSADDVFDTLSDTRLRRIW